MSYYYQLDFDSFPYTPGKFFKAARQNTPPDKVIKLSLSDLKPVGSPRLVPHHRFNAISEFEKEFPNINADGIFANAFLVFTPDSVIPDRKLVQFYKIPVG